MSINSEQTEKLDIAPKPPKKLYPSDLDRRVNGYDPKFEKGGVMYEKVHRILAMQLAGLDNKDIAAALKITPNTVRNYLSLAGKKGIIDRDQFASSRDYLEYAITPKALQVIHDALSDQNRHATSAQTVAQQVALEVAKGTTFKDFDKTEQAQASTAIQINVVYPSGPEQTVREGAITGVPAFVDGEEI